MSVSKCCHSFIEKRSGREYPDNSGFYISTSWDACGKCGDAYPIEIPTCDNCGEGAERLYTHELGGYCMSCSIEENVNFFENVTVVIHK